MANDQQIGGQDVGKRASLRDVVNYEVEGNLSESEVKLIQSTFRNNKVLIGVIRKIMVPTISDPTLPIESINDDPFLNRDWSAMPMEEAKALIVARQDAIKFVIGGLIKLQVIAHQPVETEEEKAARLKKDGGR